MEIHGIIKSKHVDQVRIITIDKKQEIDIFFTDSKKFDVEELSENQEVIFEVQIQSVDFYGLKMGKFWLWSVVFPVIKFVYKGKKAKGTSDRNWAENNKNGE